MVQVLERDKGFYNPLLKNSRMIIKIYIVAADLCKLNSAPTSHAVALLKQK